MDLVLIYLVLIIRIYELTGDMSFEVINSIMLLMLYNTSFCSLILAKFNHAKFCNDYVNIFSKNTVLHHLLHP